MTVGIKVFAELPVSIELPHSLGVLLTVLSLGTTSMLHMPTDLGITKTQHLNYYFTRLINPYNVKVFKVHLLSEVESKYMIHVISTSFHQVTS